MPKYDRRTRTSGADLAAEKERRASNLLWVRNVRVSLAEIASWQLGPDFVERRSERSTRVH
jgi:hypothetical protein